jgi:hypothetical protein
MRKKIAVLGTGTAGITSLCHLLAWLPGNDWEITSINDPNIPMLGIGESTTVSIPLALYYGAGLNLLMDSELLDSTIKTGVKYVNWRDHDINSIIHPPHYAVHFNNFKLKEVCFPRFKEKWGEKFQIVEGTINGMQNLHDKVKCDIDGIAYDFDYLIDCRGYPSDYTEYDFVDTIPVNHCLVNTIESPGDWNFTYHQAHPNGWMFGIPLQTRQGWGYLYNDTITTKDDAIKNISELFKTTPDKLNLREFSFKNYKAKRFINNRIALNGNRALFYEPLEALSGWFYDKVVRIFFDVITNTITEDSANVRLSNLADDYELFVCYIYHGGSTFQSDFWKITQNKCTNRLTSSNKFKLYTDFLKKVTPAQYDEVNGIMPMPFISWKLLDNKFNYNYFSTAEPHYK